MLFLLERVGLVADDLFASGLGDKEDLTGELGEGFAEVLPEEDTAGIVRPLERERYLILEDGWSIRKE